MKIALVHDYLSQDGGAEAVLRTISKMWPEAPIFVLFYDAEKSHPYFKDKDIYLSPMQHYPFVKQVYKWYLPMMPYATEELDLRDFDVVISSTSAFAKGVITHPGTIHISYCHTPTRYLWSEKNSYISEMKYPVVLQKLAAPILHRLRQWDQMSAERVDVFVANSKLVADRIKKYYSAPSTVIYPPVDTEFFLPAAGGERRGDYFLAASQLVPYKRIDLIVEAFNRCGLPLVVIGEGSERARLERAAKSNIRFLGPQPAAALRSQMQAARAFVFAGEEDFGIVMAEALACGTPVVAFGRGGATEIVEHGRTGILFREQTADSLLRALRECETLTFRGTSLRDSVLRFARRRFLQEFTGLADRLAHAQHGNPIPEVSNRN